MMKKHGSWQLIAWLLILTLLWGTTPAVGGFFETLSIQKERQLGEQFFLELQREYHISPDPFISSYVNRLGRKLEAQQPPHPFRYRFFVIEDPTMNAFAVPGGYIFIHTGMIRLLDREGELAGILGHEISHIYARHMARMINESKPVSIATLLGSLAAVFLGGPAAAALLVGAQAAGQAAMLKYSREHEQEADDLGFRWLTKAGFDPMDMVAAFKILNKQRWYSGGEPPIYLATHPHTDTRLVELANRLQIHEGKFHRHVDSPEFHYFALKVDAESGSPYQLLRRMTQACIHEPNHPEYFYGKALALDKLDHPDEAMAALEQGLKVDPGNYFIQREMAIQDFERSRYQKALAILTRLNQTHSQDDVVLYYMGRIYQEQHQFANALAALEKVQTLNPAFLEIDQDLGTLYGREGQIGLAHYYLGLHALTSQSLPMALFHFKKALVNLPITDPHYSRAQDQIARLKEMKVKEGGGAMSN